MKKTNKTFKRFAAITSASLLAACAMAPVFTSMTSYAAEQPLDFTLSTPTTLPDGVEIQKNVSAYEVFKISKVENTTNQYNVDGWGTGVNASNLVAALKANTTDFQVQDKNEDNSLKVDGEGNPVMVNLFKDVVYPTDSTAEGYAEKVIQSAKDVGLIIAGFDNAQKEAFAKAVMNNLDAVTATGEYTNTKDADGNITEEKVAFDDIQDGYYIMACEVKKGTEAVYTTKSLGMLTIVEGKAATHLIGTGTAKVGLPTVQKKVQEDQNANFATTLAKHETTDYSWNDVADYDIGDAVPFKLYGTMPENLDKYGAYYYRFNDTLDSQFDKPTNVIITINGEVDGVAKTTKLYYKAKGEEVSTGVIKWSYVQCTDETFEKTIETDTDKDKNCSVKYDGSKFTVAFENIKAYEGVDKDTVVTVEYKSVLNKTAVVGNPGQKNKVDLTYSNNPNFDYKPTINDDTPDSPSDENTGKTPEDFVNVHTYAVKLDKNFFNAAGKELTPAEVTEDVYDDARFSLSKGGSELYFLPSTDTDYDYVLAKEGEKVTIDGTEYAATNRLELTLESTDLVIRVKGLDEGAYTLKEEVVPTGFNKAPEQTITIDAGTVNDHGWEGTTTDETLKSFSWTVSDGTNTSTVNQGKDAEGNTYQDKDGNDIAITGEALATMENRQGTSLPGTGGIGTTIFYLGGGAMAAIGGIYLISKRRMKKSEE